MVPVSWALASADVNAGTASAARIAIIAITTSNSISVNAEMNFFIFIYFFLSAVVLRVLGSGGSPEPPRRLRSIAATKLVLRGFCCCSGVVLKNFLLRMFFLWLLIAVFTDEVNIYFLLFRAVARTAQLFARSD